jgi:hypothetical protein
LNACGSITFVYPQPFASNYADYTKLPTGQNRLGAESWISAAKKEIEKDFSKNPRVNGVIRRLEDK